MTTPAIRTGMPSVELGQAEFTRRYLSAFADPAFEPLKAELERVAQAAWEGYDAGRKSPVTRQAGAGYADPDYELSVDWLQAKAAVEAAKAQHEDAQGPSRILLINGSPRSEHTCPGEMSKSFRLIELAREVVAAEAGFEAETLDLSRTVAEYGRQIHPCKSCVSTAMPLCHWPCSCYPNHALGQAHDWMNDIYPMWVRAHGIMIVTPVQWYQAPSALKLMIDRLVCADGGNSDPTSTHGKTAEEAKALELEGWPYPRHLAGRLFAVVAHGDAAGAEGVRRALSDWLSDIGLEAAGHKAAVDGYVGYYEPYATSHLALDRDTAFQETVRNAARSLVEAVRLSRAGRRPAPDEGLKDPRPK